MQLLLLCARSQRPGYLPLDGRLWERAGAHSQPMWEKHKGAVMACFLRRTFDGTEWIYNERLLHTIECQHKKLSKTLERVREKHLSSSKKAFIKPSLEEVRAYCDERGKGIDPEAWMSHYEANGWKVGRVQMSDWRAAVRTWESKDFGNGTNRKAVEPDLSAEANPNCFTCKGEGYRASFSTPGRREPCECTGSVAAWRDRSIGSGDSLGADGTEEAWFEEPEEVSARALGASANGRGTGKV